MRATKGRISVAIDEARGRYAWASFEIPAGIPDDAVWERHIKPALFAARQTADMAERTDERRCDDADA